MRHTLLSSVNSRPVGSRYVRQGYGGGYRYDPYYDGYGDYGYGQYSGYSDPHYGGYGDDWAAPRNGAGYRGYAPPHYRDRENDDLDAVYTPFGFYEEYPRSPYGGPQPKARGQIGPYPFEVWGDD